MARNPSGFLPRSPMIPASCNSQQLVGFLRNSTLTRRLATITYRRRERTAWARCWGGLRAENRFTPSSTRPRHRYRKRRGAVRRTIPRRDQIPRPASRTCWRKTVKLKLPGAASTRELLALHQGEDAVLLRLTTTREFWHDLLLWQARRPDRFLQETERLSFPEAVERLAAEAGVLLPAADPQAAGGGEKAARACRTGWRPRPNGSRPACAVPSGARREAYLRKAAACRQDQWERFRLGFAPAGRHELKDALVQRGNALPAGADRGGPADPARGRRQPV